MAIQERYIGLLLAISSSFLIGTSYIVTKLGLQRSRVLMADPTPSPSPALQNATLQLPSANQSRVSQPGEGYDYLNNGLWWTGMILMVGGELANFAAYSFAPAILVTPLGALSVLISAVLASIFLGERLGRDGKLGCILSIIGSIIIILHAPEEHAVSSVTEMLRYAANPGFIIYIIVSIVGTLYLIYVRAPLDGRSNPLIYILICSFTGSLTVISSKALGIAIKLTVEGQNQFTQVGTYFFIVVVAGCILVQMNFFNKALDIFSTSVVTPIYYVFFTTLTIVASVLLFQGISNSDWSSIVSIFSGFITIFCGVFLLNSPKAHGANAFGNDSEMNIMYDPQKGTILRSFDEDTLGLPGLNTRNGNKDGFDVEDDGL